MATHVNGLTTLGELRHSILAVVVGNPRFTDEEQLQINHSAHELEGSAELVQWLRALRLDDARRGYIARAKTVRALPAPPVCLEQEAQTAEMLHLLACPALGHVQKAALLSLFALDCLSHVSRLRILGDAYVRVLGDQAEAEPRYGKEGLYDN
jgi:hypothetical protein